MIYGSTGAVKDTALWLEVGGDIFPLSKVAQQNMALLIHICGSKWTTFRARVGIKIT